MQNLIGGIDETHLGGPGDWRGGITDANGGNTITPQLFNQTANCNGLGLLDSTRTPATYDSTVMGGPGTYADLVTKLLAQSKDSWDVRLTASAINCWVRAGYNMACP